MDCLQVQVKVGGGGGGSVFDIFAKCLFNISALSNG